MRVDPSDVDQLAYWDRAYWVKRPDRFEEGVTGYDFVAAAGITSKDRVLDVGAARLAVDGHALGVDLSTPMLELARRGAPGIGRGLLTQAS